MRSTAARMAQEMPPLEGYSPVQWKRNLPARGFAPKTYFVLFSALLGYGWYRAIAGNRERRELARERHWARIHLMPLLIAEEDRTAVRRVYSELEREKEVMKDVEGWEAGKSVYNDGKFRTPTFAWSDSK
ncbi:CYFA0S05e02476g1_1 [Cyberlindnera fabianii]|uniref:NADH dehydrogenase [ubiquinone] 1 alpha subcomplex subunit 13 n=1 Tax=Cyberlindnera fabianii TaxID=36022 RepID=A0A061ATW4_CYBFA|nr:hypothetical protein BON22_2164 [Cyberlindnera fabianii]CDR40617.1 CYFA0S05e02476g1_1 [Cyberlindnera fabianii]